MTPLVPSRAAWLLAGALALTLLPNLGHAQESTDAVHAWKLAYARRMAREGMEQREAWQDRLRRAARARRQ